MRMHVVTLADLSFLIDQRTNPGIGDQAAKCHEPPPSSTLS